MLLSPTQWRQVADQPRPRVPKLAAPMDQAEADVLAYMSFLLTHRPKLHSTNPIECLKARSSGAPMWSAGSPMTTPLPTSSAPSSAAAADELDLAFWIRSRTATGARCQPRLNRDGP
jgi:hypothetical protein